MTEPDDTTTRMPQAPEPEQGPKRLLRSRSDRMLGGVAGGLAKYFGVDPVIFRIGFAITIIFGGLGVPAYLALLIFVPSEPKDPAAENPPALTLGRVVLTTAALIGGTIALGILAVMAAWAGATGHGVAVALLVILIGAILAASAFRGGARWLVLPALALAIPLGTVAAADVDFDGGVGERDYRPTTFGAVPDDGYELGVGQMTVDLRSLPWKPGSVTKVKTDQGVGETVIAVPGDVCVTGAADVRAGAIEIAGDEVDGLDTSTTPNAGAKATPRLDLDAHMDVGHILLINDDEAELDEHGLDRGELRARMAAACAPVKQGVDGSR